MYGENKRRVGFKRWVMGAEQWPSPVSGCLHSFRVFRALKERCGTLHWTTRAARRVGLSVPSVFSTVCLAPASLLSSSSSDRRLLSLSSRDSRSSVESSAVLSLRSSASACPSFVSASGERTLALGSRTSPRSRVMFPSSRRRWTMLWGCFKGRRKRNGHFLKPT